MRVAQVRGRCGAQPWFEPQAAGAEHRVDDGTSGITLAEARADREFWGRLVESAVGAHLTNAAMRGECVVHYWRERSREVDFVVQAGRTLTAIEVRSGRAPQARAGIAAFDEAFHPTRSLLVGSDGITVEEFLSKPVTHWTGATP